MPQPSDDGLKEYAYNTHIRWLESQVFNMASGRDLLRYQRMAREDLRRDLRRRGYIDPLEPIIWENSVGLAVATRRGEIANRSAKAQGVASFTAGPAGATVPAGTFIQDLDPYGDADQQPALDSARGAYRWETTAQLVLAADATGTVPIRATVAGAPHNICPLGSMFLAAPVTGVVSCALNAITVDGVDHQLARLASYRALTLLYNDLLTNAGDLSDTKRAIYTKQYKEEFERVISSGIEVTQDGNDDVSDTEARLRNGNVRRYRS